MFSLFFCFNISSFMVDLQCGQRIVLPIPYTPKPFSSIIYYVTIIPPLPHWCNHMFPVSSLLNIFTIPAYLPSTIQNTNIFSNFTPSHCCAIISSILNFHCIVSCWCFTLLPKNVNFCLFFQIFSVFLWFFTVFWVFFWFSIIFNVFGFLLLFDFQNYNFIFRIRIPEKWVPGLLAA